MIVILEAILSTVADAPKSWREYGETSPFSSFHCFARLPSRARDTKSGRMVVLENFDRLQLCSFSLSSRCSSRKATLACYALYIPLMVILQLTENLQRRAAITRGSEILSLRYELIAHSRLDTVVRATARQFLIAVHLSLSFLYN